MRWLNWIRRDNSPPLDLPPLEIDLLVERSLQSRADAERAIDQLRQERANLKRQRKSIERHFRQLTSGSVKTIARSNTGNPAMNTVMLQQAVGDAAAQTDATQRRDEQLTAIDARQVTARHAIERLKQVR